MTKTPLNSMYLIVISQVNLCKQKFKQMCKLYFVVSTREERARERQKLAEEWDVAKTARLKTKQTEMEIQMAEKERKCLEDERIKQDRKKGEEAKKKEELEKKTC